MSCGSRGERIPALRTKRLISTGRKLIRMRRKKLLHLLPHIVSTTGLLLELELELERRKQ